MVTKKLKPSTNRKNRNVIIVANYAEISVTIEGIVYEVDSGKCKIKPYN
jgi:HrpA-like RNA helicase